MKTTIHQIIFFLFLISSNAVQAQQFNARQTASLEVFPGRVKRAVFSKQGRYLAVSINNQINTLALYDSRFKKIWSHQGGKGYVGGTVAFSTDERHLVFSNYRQANDLAILDLQTQQVIHQVLPHTRKITHLAVSKTGNYIASAGADQQIIIWELRRGKLFKIQSFKSNAGLISDLAFDNTGEFLAAANTNQTVTLWKRNNQSFYTAQTIRFQGNIIKTLTFSPNGDYLMLGGTDKNIYAYKRYGSKFSNHYQFKAHNNAIYDLAFSPDGRYLATASADYSVKIFKHKVGEFVYEKSLFAHKSFVRAVAFSPRGNYLVSAADDRSAIVWGLNGVSCPSPSDEWSATTDQNNGPSAGGIYNTTANGLPPILSIASIHFSESQLDAGETAELRVKVKNSGPGAASQLKIRLTSNQSQLRFPQESVFPRLAANGAEETYVIDIRASEHVPSAYATLNVEVIEENFGIIVQGKKVEFRTMEKASPQLKLAEFAVLENASANPNQHIDVNEMIDVVFILQNTGQGTAQEVQVEVNNHQKGVLLLGHVEHDQIVRENPRIATMESGKFRKITYRYFVNSEFHDQKLVFEVKANNTVGNVNLQSFHEVDINKDLTPLGEIWVMDGNDPNDGEVELDQLPELNIDIRQNIPKGNMVNEDAIAVVIGNRDYRKADVPAVDYALNDALLMKQYLMRTFGYREGNILFLPNATQADFNAVFGTATNHKGKLFNYVKPNESDVSIYYSGHGAPDLETGEGYFVPVDCDPSVVSLNGYSLTTFYNNLSKIPFKSLNVVIDACFSGNSENGMLIQHASPVVIKPKNKILQHEKAIVFTSSGNEQISSWYPQKQHSLFTYFYLKGIKGAANRNKNDLLSLSELQHYLKENITYMARRLHNREQSPEVYGNERKVIVSY